MAVRQSRGRYVVEFQQAGSRVFRRLPPGATQAQARDLETRIRRAVFDDTALGRRHEVSLPGAIALWLEAGRRKNTAQAESEAKQWEKYVEAKPISAAPDVAAEALKAWRKAAAKPATINRRLALLKAVCKHAWRTKVVDTNYSPAIALLPENNAREVFLTRVQVMAWASKAKAESPEARAAVILLAYTGLRVSELLAQGPTRAAELRVSAGDSKTRKARVVPVPKAAQPALRALPLGLTYWQLHDQLMRAAAAAELHGVRIHDLRHTCASWLINQGVDLYTVGRILGHAGPETTKRYAHLVRSTLRRAMARLK